MGQIQVEIQARNIAVKMVQDWGVLRRFISAHPLSGFYLGMMIGAGIGGMIVWVM